MAPPTTDQLQLIRRFEPILFFDPAERFFPSDAKRYLEHCALWKSTAPFLTMKDWQNPPPAPTRQPAIAPGKIGAVDGQAPVYLGRKTPAGDFEFLETPPNQECFFDLGGWKPAGTPFPPADRYADLDRIAERYRTEPALNESQFWYHAEYFDASRLRRLFNFVKNTGGHDFRSLFRLFGSSTASLNIPSLICYYLFFPGHDEGLPGCEGAAEAREFASFAGEWQCIALLLDQATDGTYSAKFMGLTGPNIGVVLHDGEEVRVGMRIFSWDIADQQRFDDHPRLAIAKGSHALYIPGAADRQEPVTPFTPDDPSRNSCGRAEPPAASLSFQETEYPGAGEAIGILLSKTLGLAFASGGLAFIPGAIWGLLEVGDAGDPKTVTVPLPPPPGLGAPVDNVTTAGEVIHPKAKLPAGVPSTRAHPWRSENLTLPNGRSYDFTVDRDAQILWPGDPDYKGYTGRWGPRVEADAQTRRAGMRFPNFWRMFFDELVRRDPPKPLPPPVAIPRTEGTAIGNALSGSGLAAAYDGVTNQIWSKSPVGNAPSLYNGKRFATSYFITGIKIWVSTDRGFSNNADAANPDGATASGKCTVYGRSGADPATPTDGAVLREFTIQDLANPDPANPSVAIMDGFNTSAGYDRVWVTIANPTRANLAVFTEIEWYGIKASA